MLALLKHISFGTILLVAVSSCSTVEIDNQKGDQNYVTNSDDEIVFPVIPFGLIVTGATPTSVTVAWEEQIQKAVVAQYEIVVNGSGDPITVTAPSTSVIIDGLTQLTEYDFQIRACDVKANCSDFSDSVAGETASAPDTAAPTVPSGLMASGATMTTINLNWNTSNDNVGVVLYRIQTNNANPVTVNAPTLMRSMTGLTAGTSYNFRIQACDASNNCSAYSSNISASTMSAPDTSAPTVPTGLASNSTTMNSVNLIWNASTDNVGVARYEIQTNSSGTPASVNHPTLTRAMTGLAANTTYNFRVRACDASSNCSAYSSNIAVTTTAAPDTTAPTVPTGLAASGNTSSTINLNWNASTDAVGVTRYEIQTNSTGTPVVVNAPTVTKTMSGLTASTQYQFRVRACDVANNCSAYSANITSSTTAAADTTAPTVPTGLAASGNTSSTINLNWNASTDAVGVTRYEIQTNSTGTPVSVNHPTLNRSMTGLTANTSYNFRIRACDGANNCSSYSSNITSSTLAVVDTTAPSVPSGLSVLNLQQTSATLSWNASTDNVGVTGYEVSIDNGSAIAVSGTSYGVSGYTAGSTHNFKVRAKDAAGNTSSYATAVNFTMQTASVVTTFPSSYSSQVSVIPSAVVSSNTITLKWSNVTGVSYNTATISRKTKTQTSWTQIGTTAGSNNQYVDSTPVVGTYYEYKIQISTSVGTAYGYVASGIQVPVVENRGKLLLMIDSAVANLSGMSTRLNTLRTDLKSDGWTLVDLPQQYSVPTVKTAIVNAYNADPTNVKALLIIGHIPVPRSGLAFAPDGHGDHVGAWNADNYYADINGTWTDSGNNTSNPNSFFHNTSGDGKFDQSNFPSSLELQMGRIDFNWMDEFSTSYGIQHDPIIYNAYFDRLHAYKVKSTIPQNRAFIQDNFHTSPGYNFAATGFRNFGSFVGPSNITSRTGSSPTMFSDLNNQSYLFAYGCGGGGYSSASGISTTGELADGNWGGVFNFMFGSYFGDWDTNHNGFLNAIISKGSGLTNMWLGGTQGHLHNMAMGDTIGYVATQSMNNKISGIYYPESGGNGTSVGSYDNVELALLGDPTLRINMLKPPSNLAVNVSGNLLFSWTAPAGETGVSYIVYEVGANGGLTRITPTPITATSYQSSVTNAVQNKNYIVKTYKLTTSQTGSYYNMSIGSNVVTR
jgi:chitodextrinase